LQDKGYRWEDLPKMPRDEAKRLINKPVIEHSHPAKSARFCEPGEHLLTYCGNQYSNLHRNDSGNCASPLMTKVRYGLVVDEILAEASIGNYDQVVIGAYISEGWGRFLLDDLAEDFNSNVSAGVGCQIKSRRNKDVSRRTNGVSSDNGKS